MEVIRELAAELAHELTHEWVTLLIELVQFAILIVLIKAVAFGMGSRRGMIPNMLDSRRERVSARLDEARERERESALAPQRADDILAEARVKTQSVLREAEERAQAEREKILAEAREQVEAIERQTTETLAHEREEVLGGVRDVLLDVVARGTRQVLDEGYSASQQKDMIQAAILDSIDGLESVTLN